MWWLKIMANPMARINYNEIRHYEDLLHTDKSPFLKTDEIMQHISDLWQEINNLVGLW